MRVRRALVHLRDWSGVAALLLVLTGGVAYAANTIASEDIINGEVKTADLGNDAVNTAKIADGQVTEPDIGQAAVASAEIKNDAVTSPKVLNGTLLGGDVADNALKGADIDESTLAIGPSSGEFVHGRGTLLSNRVTMAAGTFKTLLRIPGLGEFGGLCGEAPGEINWSNTTPSNIDVWEAGESASVVPPDDGKFIATLDGFADATVALGLGNDPGSRRIATVHVFGFQSAPGAPCGFQAQGTLWTSG